MKPRITVLTLGVSNLERAVEFYKKLGFTTPGIIGQEHEYGAVAFFELQSGVQLALWPYKSIEHDTGLRSTGANPAELTLGHNVATKQQVDETFATAIQAGATAVKAPQDTFWGGYSAYFQDVDGHAWEIVWNPDITVQD